MHKWVALKLDGYAAKPMTSKEIPLPARDSAGMGLEKYGALSDVFACSKMPRLGNGNSTSVTEYRSPLWILMVSAPFVYYTVCSHYIALSFLGGSTVGAAGAEYCNYRRVRISERETVMETASSYQ